LEYATVTHKKACRWNAPGLLAVTGYARAGNQLEMAEMDILSTRSAIEKACWEIDFEPPTAGDVSRPVRPAEAGPLARRCAVPPPERSHRPGRR
jgi:hypothetical protein